MIKRSIPLLTFTLVFAAAAVTLCFRVLISSSGRDPFFTTVQDETQNLPPVFNASLLTFSAVDLSEDSLRQNVEHLMGVDFRTENNKLGRPFLSVGRLRSARSVRGNPMELASPDSYKILLKFRQYLRNWWRNHHFKPDIMSNMVNVKYKTCAVVGNSGILLKRAQGEAIDNHDFVIRLNNARINGYERFVGSKTSLSFMNSNILHLCSRRGGCFCHPYGEKVPIIIYISQPVHFLDYTICNSSLKAPLTITDPHLDVLCARIVKYYSVKRFVKETGKPIEEWSLSHGGPEFHYSSGMQAVMFAVRVCDKVSIFGFGKSNSAKHHYHTNQKTELSLHDYQAEYNLYEDLAKNPEAVPFIDKFTFPSFVIHR